MRLKKNIMLFVRIALVSVLCMGLFAGCECTGPGSVDGLKELETKDILDEKTKEIQNFLGTFRPQMSEEQRAALVNPEAAILQISITNEGKLQVVDPVIEMDTSTPMYTYEDIQNAKSVINRSVTKVYDITSPKTVDGRQVLEITGEDGTKGTITILSYDQISVSFGNGSMTYDRV